MTRRALLSIGLVILSGTSALAQTRYPERIGTLTASPKKTIVNPFAGKWTYRSYHNRPEVIVDQDANAALGLLFGEGVITVQDTDLQTFKGSFDMGGGYLLEMAGTVKGSPATFEISGKGVPGTLTDGWQYDYVGYLVPNWPNGIGQVPAIVGTVIRTKPHGNAKAGYVASFIAVKHP
jgi:hypothetical protein